MSSLFSATYPAYVIDLKPSYRQPDQICAWIPASPANPRIFDPSEASMPNGIGPSSPNAARVLYQANFLSDLIRKREDEQGGKSMQVR